MTNHKIVGRGEWETAREELLRLEKEYTRAGDDLARRRRELPWVVVEKQYVLDTDDGPRILAEIIESRRPADRRRDPRCLFTGSGRVDQTS